MDELERRAMLDAALPMLSSYAWGESVSLGAQSASLGLGADESVFSSFLRARHALGEAPALRDIVQAIERQPSGRARIERARTRGSIRGHLDVPRYVKDRTRFRAIGRPRTYPVLRISVQFSTPENQLALESMRSLSAALTRAPFAQRTAERIAIRDALSSLHRILRRLPWSDLATGVNQARLHAQVTDRLRKRRTSNPVAYADLLAWSGRAILSAVGAPERVKSLQEGLLAFPIGDFFWDRVFEVWALSELLKALEDLPMERSMLRPLAELTKGPIARFERSGRPVEVFYQNSKPLPSGRWQRPTGALRGIPDVLLSSPGHPPHLIDFKFRPELCSAALGGDLQASRLCGEFLRRSSPPPLHQHADLPRRSVRRESPRHGVRRQDEPDHSLSGRGRG